MHFFSLEYLDGKDCGGDLEIDGRIILKCILNK